MKKWFLKCTLMVLLCHSSAHASPVKFEGISEIINLKWISKEKMEAFFRGLDPSIVVECEEGLILPFRLSVSGGFLELEDRMDQVRSIKLLQTCYVRFQDEVFFFSKDLENWKPLDEYFTGNFSIVLSEAAQDVQIKLQLDSR